jgi:hypothetical protein
MRDDMLFQPCENCTDLVSEPIAEKSLEFTKRVLDNPQVLCNTCRTMIFETSLFQKNQTKKLIVEETT